MWESFLCGQNRQCTPARKDALTMGELGDLKYELLEYAPYLSDLAPFGSHLFPNLKRSVAGKLFWVKWRDNGRTLGKMCVEVKGDYVEKWIHFQTDETRSLTGRPRSFRRALVCQLLAETLLVGYSKDPLRFDAWKKDKEPGHRCCANWLFLCLNVAIWGSEISESCINGCLYVCSRKKFVNIYV